MTTHGTFTAPKQTGPLTFTGTAAGYGLYATEVPTVVRVGTSVPGLTVTVNPPIVNGVQAGQSIQGHVSFDNRTGATGRVRLELSVSHARAAITSPAGVITARPGSTPDVPFTITVAKDSPAGAAWLEVKAVDAANPGVLTTPRP